MGLFDKVKGPVFLKEDSIAEIQLAALEQLLPQAPAGMVPKIEKEIRNQRAGIAGEKQILFELKNSHIPMYVLHDLYLEYEGLSAQIDFLVITRRRNFVIECKNLYGNIEINNHGDFIRHMTYRGRNYSEKMYSPITQNERHLALIKQLRMAEKGNILTKTFLDKNFDVNYRSVIVIANSKTILNDKYAKKEIKNQVIPADRLVSYIKMVNSEKNAEDCFEKDMISLAEFFLNSHREQPDFVEKFKKQIMEMKENEQEAEEKIEEQRAVFADEVEKVTEKTNTDTEAAGQILCPRCGAPMVRRTAAKGVNAGKEFYGCSRFPRCRGIVNIQD